MEKGMAKRKRGMEGFGSSFFFSEQHLDSTGQVF
jgi:hypothetical protein